MGKQVPDIKEIKVRELLFKKNYRIIYRILDKKIQIITVRHVSRLMKF